jgi:hypothetical protein
MVEIIIKNNEIVVEKIALLSDLKSPMLLVGMGF